MLRHGGKRLRLALRSRARGRRNRLGGVQGRGEGLRIGRQRCESLGIGRDRGHRLAVLRQRREARIAGQSPETRILRHHLKASVCISCGTDVSPSVTSPSPTWLET